MFAREAGAGRVDLVRPLGNFGEDRDAIFAYFDETAGDVKLRIRSRLVVSEYACFQLSDERRVTRQNLHLAGASGYRDGIYRFHEDTAFGSDDFKLELISHLII